MAYNHKLLRHLTRQGIEYSVTADMNEPLKQKIRNVPRARWKPLLALTEAGWVPTGAHWAEVEYVSGQNTCLAVEPCRFLVVRYTDRIARLDEKRGGAWLPGLKDHTDFHLRYGAIATTMTSSSRVNPPLRCDRLRFIRSGRTSRGWAASPPGG